MTEPTIDERLDIWRVAYSRASLLQAKGIADVLLTVQSDLSHDHRIGLLTGLVVTYARPFTIAQVTRTKRIVPMHDVEIPAAHRELHESFMEMRHQVFGHKDATEPVTDDGVVNQIQFVFNEGHMDLHTVTPGYYDPEKLIETKALCDSLVSVLDVKLNHLMELHPMPISEPQGTYVLNIDDPARPWVVKA